MKQTRLEDPFFKITPLCKKARFAKSCCTVCFWHSSDCNTLRYCAKLDLTKISKTLSLPSTICLFAASSGGFIVIVNGLELVPGREGGTVAYQQAPVPDWLRHPHLALGAKGGLGGAIDISQQRFRRRHRTLHRSGHRATEVQYCSRQYATSRHPNHDLAELKFPPQPSSATIPSTQKAWYKLETTTAERTDETTVCEPLCIRAPDTLSSKRTTARKRTYWTTAMKTGRIFSFLEAHLESPVEAIECTWPGCATTARDGLTYGFPECGLPSSP